MPQTGKGSVSVSETTGVKSTPREELGRVIGTDAADDMLLVPHAGKRAHRLHEIDAASGAVRALWRELATTRELPAFLKGEEGEEQSSAKVMALKALAGSARGSLTQASDAELEELGRQRYA